MEKNKTFENLRIWQEGHRLAVATYRMTAGFPQEEKFGLVSQMRRAAVSVPANIAEGKGRNSVKDYMRFLHIARGSLKEVIYYWYLVHELGYVPKEIALEMHSKYSGLDAGLNSCIDKLK